MLWQPNRLVSAELLFPEMISVITSESAQPQNHTRMLARFTWQQECEKKIEHNQDINIPAAVIRRRSANNT